MHSMSLTKDDQEKVIEFMNFVATKAEFKSMSTQEIIEYFKLLKFMQMTLLPKLEANIVEVEEVVHAKKDEEPQAPEAPSEEAKQ